jgi:uncharacterized OB-fold protein
VTILEPNAAHITGPTPSPATAPFWDGCKAHELRYLRCTTCSFATHPPALACPTCGLSTFEWAKSSGRGEIFSWTTIWRPPHPAFEVPYVAIIVELEEAWSLISNLVGCAPDDVAIGLRVAVEFHETADGAVLPYFRPIDGTN